MEMSKLGKVIKVVGYRPPGWIYGRYVLVLTEKGEVYGGLEGGKLLPVVGDELQLAKKILEMNSPYKNQEIGKTIKFADKNYI